MEFEIYDGDGAIHPALTVAMSGLRKCRLHVNQAQMLFWLVGGEGVDKEKKKIKYNHLQCEYIGPISYETFELVFLQKKLNCDILQNAYENDIQNCHRRVMNSKKQPLSKTAWLEHQWETYRWAGYGIINEKPIDVSHDPNEYTMAYIDDTKIVPGPTDAWDEFLSQVKNTALIPTFRAFMWAAFDPVNNGRQILYIYDPKGYTGKSRVVEAIIGACEAIVVSINAKSMDNRFLISQLFGKRILFYPDCKNVKILHYELIHSLTGGDPMPVEFKFASSFTCKMYMRCIVMSNDPPSVSRYREHEMSRIIPIELDASLCTSKIRQNADGDNIGNNDYVGRLKDQFWNFLYACRVDYEKLCPTRCDIIVPKNSFDQLQSDVEVEFEEIMEKFEITKDYNDMILATDMYNKFFEDFKNQRFSSSVKHELTVFLNSRGVKLERLTKDKQKHFFYTGIKEKVGYSGTSASNNSIFDDVKYS
jgi:hypothetical protein